MSDVKIYGHQLGLTVIPFEGETPASIVARIAAKNGVVPRELCSDLGLRWPFLCSGYSEQLLSFADMAGLNFENLTRWNPEKIGVGRYRVGWTRSSTGVFRRTATRVCSICIEEALQKHGRHGAYQLLEWNVMCLYGCERHNSFLVELPRAGTSHETYDVVAQITQHRDVVKLAADAQSKYVPTVFEKYVRIRINDGPQADWLSGLELSQLHGACRTLGAAICGTSLPRFVDLGPENERQFCVEGLGILSAGPESLIACMELLKSRSSARRPYFSADLGPFYTWLHDSRGDLYARGIVDCVHKFTVRSYPIKPGKRVLGRPVPDLHRMSFDAACKQSGFGVALLKRLISHVENLSATQSAALTDITPDQLSRALHFWGKLRNLQTVAEMLNVSRMQVKGLIGKGVLRSVRFGTALRYVFVCDVDRLLAKVTALPEVPCIGAFLPLRDHCRNQRIGLVHLITLWQEGKMEGFAHSTGVMGLQAIRVLQEVDAERRDNPISMRDLTLLETAAYLKIGVGAIRVLRNAGYLRYKTCLNTDTNYRHSLITWSSVLWFEERFLTLGQLATESKVAPMHLARRLDKEGVPTVICGSQYVRVYERSQFAEHRNLARRTSVA